jgi:phage shock protein C
MPISSHSLVEHPLKTTEIGVDHELARALQHIVHADRSKADPDRSKIMQAHDIPAKKDNLVGICNALGEDLGVNANILRVALGVTLLLSPEIALIAYGTCGLLVLINRIINRLVRSGPKAQTATRVVPETVSVHPQPVAADELLLAA